ncbi:MAG: alginate export family protein [Alphaproteobacteria bacterium]|nr:alginate export family protein [Alphaproteobacteria bacterium]MDP6515788.1 alginate export family protein [Alphaproteobacteria bacterium]
MTLFESNGFTLDAGLEAVVSAIATDRTNFGAGLAEPDGTIDGDVDWAEGFVHPALSAEFTDDRTGRFLGAVSFIGAATRGIGDVSGGSFGQPEHFAHERLFLGWSSGALWPELGDDAITVTLGDQDFEIGDGWLISDGVADGVKNGAFYLGPRNVFKKSAVVTLETQPVRGDLFYLDSQADQGGSKLAGLDIAYVDSARGSLGAYYFRIFEVDDPDFAARDGLDVFGLHGQGHPLQGPGLDPVFLSAEYTLQRNDAAGRDADAWAWYVEAGYRLADAPWSPELGYRYSRFGGDDPATAEVEAFDPLFVGAPRGWGTWFQGEITGQYLFNHSNLGVHMVRLGARPHDDWELTALAFDIDFDEPASAGAVASDFAHEVNLIADWAVSEFVTLSGFYGIAIPGRGAIEAFGDNQPFQLFGLICALSY